MSQPSRKEGSAGRRARRDPADGARAKPSHPAAATVVSRAEALVRLHGQIGNRAMRRFLPRPTTHPAGSQPVQRAPNDPMTAGFVRTRATPLIKTVLNGRVARTAFRRLARDFPARLPAAVTARLRAGLQGQVRTRQAEFDAVVQAFNAALVERCDGVWEQFFEDNYADQLQALGELPAYTTFVGNLAQDRQAAVAKANLVDAQIEAKVIAFGQAKTALDQQVAGIAQAERPEHSQIASVERTLRYLGRRIQAYTQRAGQIGTGRARITATPFTYADGDAAIAASFDATRAALVAELGALRDTVTAAADQAEAYEVQSVGNEFYEKLSNPVKRYFEPQMELLEDIVRRSATVTTVAYLNGMIRDGDTAPLDAFVALSHTLRTFLLNSLQYDATMRQHLFHASWSAAEVAGFIAQAQDIQQIGRLSDPAAGGGGTRFPHHLREHGPAVPAARAQELAAGKLGGLNSRWASFAVMNTCLTHAVTTLNASTRQNDPYNVTRANLGGTVAAFLAQHPNDTKPYLENYVVGDVTVHIPMTSVAGLPASLTSLGPQFDQNGVAQPISGRFQVGFSLRKVGTRWKYVIVTAFPRT